MKVVLTNLSNKLYEDSRLQLNNSARRFGIEHINSYDFENIKHSSFYTENKTILDQPKGIGYWLWKPYIILQTLKNLAEGDIVVYSDCGVEFIADIEPLINICKEKQPVLLFANGNFKNRHWTKRDCFVLMDCDSKTYWNGLQCDAAFSLFRNCKESINFLNDWLKYGSDERILTDLPNTQKKNFFTFIEHRWDQSVLSLLAIKHGFTLYRMPTQFGNHYKAAPYRIAGEFNCVNQHYQKQVNYYAKNAYHNSTYGQLLSHHRTKSRATPVADTVKKASITDILIRITKKALRRFSYF